VAAVVPALQAIL